MTDLADCKVRREPCVSRGRRRARALALGAAMLAAVCATSRAATDATSLSLEELLDVTITGASKYDQKQGEAAAAVSVITRQEIQTFGWRTLAEALASLPGMYVTDNRQSTFVGTRGFGLPGDFNTRLLVMIDGNRINDPTYDSAGFGWQFPIDMDLVERIEFIPGPGGAVYGQNAMFGVVNVITRTGAEVNGAELAATYQDPQELREGRASWGAALDGGIDLLLSASGMQSRGQDLFFDYGAYPRSGVAADMDGQKDEHLFARLERGPWSVEQIYAWGQKQDPTASFFSTPLVQGQSAALTSTLTQAKYQDAFADDTLQVRARVFNGSTDTLETLNYGAFFQTRGQSQWDGAEVSVLSSAVAGHKLLLGLEGQDDPVSNQGVHGIGFVDPAENFLIQAPGYRIGIYAQDEWRVADNVTATLGLREDSNNVTGTRASPRAALIWRSSQATTLKALYGIAHRAPNEYEREYGDNHSQVANPALRGESIDTLELVADQRVSRDLTLRVSLYQWRLHDLIIQGIDPVLGVPQYQSGPEVEARGIEVSADKTWDSGARLRASLSSQDADYVDSGALPNSGLLNSPKTLGKLNLSLPLPAAGLRIGYETDYDSSRMTRDGVALGGYSLSNIIVSSDALARGLNLSVGVSNVLGKRYAEPAAINNWQNSLEQDGRSIRLKLMQKF